MPVATVTTATVLTTSLISFGKSDLDKKKEDEDKEINDFVKPSENFEEETLFYSKDGDADKLKTVDKEKAKQIEKLMKENGGKLIKGEKLGNTVQEQKSEIDSDNHENQSKGDVIKIDPSENTLPEDGDSTVSSAGGQEDSAKLSEPSSPIGDFKSTDSNLQNDHSETSLNAEVKNSEIDDTPILDTKKEVEDVEQKDRGEEVLDLQLRQSTEEQSPSSSDNSIERNDGLASESTNVISEAIGGEYSETNLERSGTKGDPENLGKGDNEIFTSGNSDRYSDEAIKRLEEIQGELSEFENSLRQLIS